MASQVIDDLLVGNQRFVQGISIQSSKTSLAKLKESAKKGQNPKAVILCCSDSRAPVEFIFDQDVGDLFVIRVAGNVVAPSLIGSVEFAASNFGTELVMVMGHSNCGAIAATLNTLSESATPASENLGDIVSRIQPHVEAIAHDPKLSHDDKVAKAVEVNVKASVELLSGSSDIIQDLIDDGKLTIVGAVLDLHSGKVELV